MKTQAEVLAFGEYMFESLESFKNSQVKSHVIFSMSYLYQIRYDNVLTLNTTLVMF